MMCQCGIGSLNIHGSSRPRVTDDPIEQSKHIRCLVYRVHDGKTVPEVARIMGVSACTVKNWTRLALGYYGAPEVKVIRKMLVDRNLDRD